MPETNNQQENLNPLDLEELQALNREQPTSRDFLYHGTRAHVTYDPEPDGIENTYNLWESGVEHDPDSEFGFSVETAEDMFYELQG